MNNIIFFQFILLIMAVILLIYLFNLVISNNIIKTEYFNDMQNIDNKLCLETAIDDSNKKIMDDDNEIDYNYRAGNIADIFMEKNFQITSNELNSQGHGIGMVSGNDKVINNINIGKDSYSCLWKEKDGSCPEIDNKIIGSVNNVTNCASPRVIGIDNSLDCLE